MIIGGGIRSIVTGSMCLVDSSEGGGGINGRERGASSTELGRVMAEGKIL